ncbi:hypothetical protein Taro_019439 [Colocasia esculenta]|uniref:Uncharacterized protein n=1 Tax=Colocasia esculenta TaxID=4460 RepID=A0A843UTW8_COLES|nr:hypothetical protein [Colocasia esculenta]
MGLCWCSAHWTSTVGWRPGLTRALFLPHSLPSSSPTFTLELLYEFWWSTGVRGAAVVRVVAANQAGKDELERGVHAAFLEFRRDSRFFGSLIAFLRVLHAGELGGLNDPDIGSCFFGLSLAYNVRPIGVEVSVVTVLFWVAPAEPVTR